MKQDTPFKLDTIDKTILTFLQSDGRLSNVQLAEKVGLSESSCLRRVKNLEQSGVIDRHVTLINQAAIGKPNIAFVRVTLEGQQLERLRHFEEEIVKVKDVLECYLMSGDSDYLLQIITRDNEDYMRIHNRLTNLPGVLRVQSSFAMKTVVRKTELPLD